tara:strand:- start:18 stop:389 length:372 start_codon:yes stop_codon:yes gene_type:complete
LAAQHRLSGAGASRIGASSVSGINKDPGGVLSMSLVIRNSGGSSDSVRLFLTEGGKDLANTFGWVKVSPGASVRLNLAWPVPRYAPPEVKSLRLTAKNNSGKEIWYRRFAVTISAIPIDIAFE